MEKVVTNHQQSGRNGWSLRSVITLTIFSVMIMVIMMITMLVINITLTPTGSFLLTSGISALLTAPFYFIILKKVDARGTAFSISLLLGIFFLVTGQFYSFIIYLVLGVVAELVLLVDGYHRRGRTFIAYLIFSWAYIGGGILPMVLMKDQYLSWLSGYADAVTADATIFFFGTPQGIAASSVICLIGAALGYLLAQRILNRHVAKAKL